MRLPSSREIEVDESYFGGRRKDLRGRSGGAAAGKGPVLRTLRRAGKVHSKVILNIHSATLKRILKQKIVADSIVYIDSLQSYNVLDESDFHHARVNHSQLFAEGRKYTKNGT